MERRKFIALGVAAVAAVSLAACDTPSAGSSGAASPGGKSFIAIVSKGFQHQFWQSVKQGAEKAAKEFNVDISFEGPDKETNVQQQVDQLNQAMAKSPQALAIAALDSKAVEGVLQDAKSKNIPVIAFDSGVDSDIPLATASTDNKAAAAEAAKHLAQLIGNEGKVAIIGHSQTATSGTDRRDGFVDWLKTNAPKVTIVDIQYGDGDQLKSTDLAKTILTANPDLKGMYGTNEGSAIGVVNAVQELGISGKLKVVGFDSGKAQIDAIKSGLMAGAITQNPVGIGYETVKAAVAAIKGEKLEKVIDTGFYWYDKSNIDDPKIAANLYQ
ncbi:ABC transporter substrate-binding protein [Psychromicrobium lacuslunae]|uniref:LacI family transcriptional regulator n=1 Tax=Psychromicrobium lacuslunae TaxID=1618207 RepID=A0A0D4C0B4_9MICC|nr:ABC transporter substrate-binding protein [Psychromicrobium lacuslunae]AJT42112.1 LacI family transcriptional regulator [Psychromicrobium lacuslunae]